jgi:hypothetical protein
MHLLDVSLPDEEGDDKEHGNDQWREDVGGGPSLNRTRRNSEDKEDDSGWRERELVISWRRGKLGHSQDSVAIPKMSKRALETGFVEFGMRIKHVIPITDPMIAVK